MKPPPDGLVSGVRTATANQPSQIGGKMRRLAAKNASTCAKTAQNAKGEMNLAMKPPPDGLVSGVRTATANQPSQNGGKMRRLTAKNASTCAKTAQNAKGGGKKRLNLRRNGPEREGWRQKEASTCANMAQNAKDKLQPKTSRNLRLWNMMSI